ncbi:polymer-forming cytoskeletal protein [Treponema sp. OMZ 840]|uniref:bactofilin family protein n=1 Tax=Treponema sp. OMZ 840 TaxID=244313 RepID=UPI003D920CC5
MISQYDDISVNTLIAPGTFIKGDMHLEGFIRLDGDIDGNIETSGKIIIGRQARVRGNITALAAVINGIVEGDIVAPEKVELFSTASVRGDVITKKITVEENVFIQGHCIVLDDEQAFSDAKDLWQDAKAIRRKAFAEPRDGF